MPRQMIYTTTQGISYPGMSRDMAKWNARTFTAAGFTPEQCAVQREGQRRCRPLQDGAFAGISLPMRLLSAPGAEWPAYDDSDNVPVVSEGVIAAIADAALAEGVGLSWNTSTWRWSPLTSGTNIARTPGVEAGSSAAGAGSLFWLRIRRVRT